MRIAPLIAGACIAAMGAYAWQRSGSPSAATLPSPAAHATAGTHPDDGQRNPFAMPSASQPRPSAAPRPMAAATPGAPASAAPVPIGTLLAQAPGGGPAGGPDAASDGTAPAPLPPAEVAANEALRQLGYYIDQRYYRMDVASLRKAAAGNDVQALTHLAERYMFELDGHPQAPGFEPGFPYLQAARDALQAAYALGNLHAAAMLSESFLVEKRPIDAAAWNLIAQRSGDKLSAEWFQRTEDYQRMTGEQRTKASLMADGLWAALQAKKPPGS